MVAPSLALILYRPDALPMFDGRPALELVDRLLPEPGTSGDAYHPPTTAVDVSHRAK
jgi:hypothetical protein